MTDEDNTAPSNEGQGKPASGLAPEIAEDVARLEAEGTAFALRGDCADAAARFETAMRLLKQSNGDKPLKQRLRLALAEVYFRMGEFNKCKEYLLVLRIFSYEWVMTQPLLSVRLGQTYCETDRPDLGAGYFKEAVLLGGWSHLVNEPQKYIDAMKAHAKAPKDGWPDERSEG